MSAQSALRLAVAFAALWTAAPVSAQVTTGFVTGTVKDAQGGVIPGATAVLVSETKGTTSAPTVTNATGDYVFPNVTADTYSLEVTMAGFKVLTRRDVKVSAGDRVSLPTLTLEVGGLSETIDVAAVSALLQASSGERSFAVATEEIANLPINRGNFTSVTALAPGVQSGGASAGGTRIGGAGQNNIMIDGVSAMDTGNNGQMLAMSIESIDEVKILTQGYQAEYGRSSGLQITAVTRSGTNRFRGSAFSVFTDSDWSANSWVNVRNGDPKLKAETKTLGYSVGGPAGKPGGSNRLFFFYSHEYRPSTTPINGGNPIRLRVPTFAERAGDFSQTLNTNAQGQSLGTLNPFIKDPNSTAACSAANTAGCFQDGGVVGRIPSNRLYAAGIAVLNRYPGPHIAQALNTSYNYELQPPSISNLTQQPAVRIDYHLSSKLRFSGKYSGQRARRLVTPGTIPGFNDTLNPYPYITNYGVTVNYTMTPTTFIEGTYGFIRNQLGSIPVNESANRLTSLPGFPVIYSDAGKVDPRYYTYGVLQDLNPVWWDGTSINLTPALGWGNRIGTPPPSQPYGFLNINRTQDVAFSLTKVLGRHTIKAGAYNNHSYKAQNTGTLGGLGLSFQGFVNFGNDPNNALDTTFGFANAAVGVFTQYFQQSKLIEGSMIYNNTEFYLQDNWKVGNRLTLDYGIRFTRQQPQYDQFLQMSNFFPAQWSASAAPLLYVAGCSNGATVCSGNTKNAMHPVTGEILAATGAANTQAAIGTIVSNSGNITNGIRRAGDGIADTSYVWPNLVIGPRAGVAYDVTGKQGLIIRGGAGLFYDRPDGNTVFSIPGNPPLSTSQDLRNSQLQTLGAGLSPIGVPALTIFQYDAKVPSSVQWQGGVQIALPWVSMVDVSYVGNHGFNRLGAFQGAASVNLNAVDFGTAYRPESQDLTLGTLSTPGAGAAVTSLLRPYRGLSFINQQTTEFWDSYHSIQANFNRRFRNGVQFGLNYTLSLSFTGNTGLQKRLEHASDGTISIRSDQTQYEEQNKDLNLQRHIIKGNWVWDLPNLSTQGGSASRVIAHVLNDWQLAGILTAGSGNRYDLAYAYAANGQTVNLTGSPDYAAKIVFTGDPGSGCSDDLYRQFNAAAVTGPTYKSVGLESGRNLLRGCPDHTIDLAIARTIRLGGGRQVQFRVDAYNAFNAVIINGRQTVITYNNPVDKVISNSQTLLDGTVDPTRLKPINAGFGAATSANAMRTVQAALRFSF